MNGIIQDRAVCVLGAMLMAGACWPSRGQDPAPTALQATVLSVHETRHTRATTGQSNVELEFSGAGIGDKAVISQVTLDRAVDALGNDLLRQKGQVLGKQRLRQKPGATEATLPLLATARGAETIRLIEGTVTLQTFSADSVEDLDVAGLIGRAGEFSDSESLKKRGVRLAYVNEATFDDKGSRLLEALVTEGKDLSEEQRRSVVGAALAPFKVILSQPDTAFLVLDDPADHVVSLALRDPEDPKDRPLRHLRHGLWLMTDPHGQGARLRLRFTSDAGEIKLPFRVENVPLP